MTQTTWVILETGHLIKNVVRGGKKLFNSSSRFILNE